MQEPNFKASLESKYGSEEEIFTFPYGFSHGSLKARDMPQRHIYVTAPPAQAPASIFLRNASSCWYFARIWCGAAIFWLISSGRGKTQDRRESLLPLSPLSSSIFCVSQPPYFRTKAHTILVTAWISRTTAATPTHKNTVRVLKGHKAGLKLNSRHAPPPILVCEICLLRGPKAGFL